MGVVGAWLAARFAGWGAKLALAGAFVGLVLLGCLRLIGIGKKAEQGAQLARNAKAQERITNADARGPRTPDDVDKRLSDGTF